MSKSLSALALVAITSAAFAQGTPMTPSQTPSVTPSETPSVTPSQTPSVAPSQPPSIAVGGLSRCENLLGDEREKCQKEERAGAGATGPQPAAPATPSGSVR